MLKNNTFIPSSRPAAHHQPLLHIPHVRLAGKVVKRIVLCVAGAYALIVAGQLVYPAKRSVPNVNFGGYNLGNTSETEIKNQLAQIDSKSFTARTKDKSYAQTLGEIGISLDAEQIARELADYPLAQRLMPFSVFYYQPEAPDGHLIVHNKEKFDAFAAKIAAENNSEAIEGTVSNESGEFIIVRSEPGRRYAAATIASYFSAFTSETLADEAALPFDAVSPINTYQYLDELVKKTTDYINGSHTIGYAGANYEVTKESIKRAVRFKKNDQQKVAVYYDPSELAFGLEAIADGVFFAPANAAGHELNWIQTAEALAVALESNASAEAVVKPLTASSSVRYPATSKGIQRLIEDWQASHKSIGPVISFSEIGGYARKASVGGDTRYFSASIYKVFPAWYALDQIDQGKLDAHGVIANGMKLEACFNDMIIISQSNCPEPIVYKYGGWGVMDEFARTHGIEGITLSSGVTVTANGMASFMTKLHNGELLSPERTNYLLDTMKRQKYRTGFAASNFAVANKVGYQPQTKSWHDAAIMYHPNGTYVLVALTKTGATLPTLSTLAKQINDTLAR